MALESDGTYYVPVEGPGEPFPLLDEEDVADASTAN